MAGFGEAGEETSSCMKYKKSFRLAEKLLRSQEEFCSVELVH